MEFTVQIFSENAAFEGDPQGEVARILRGVTEQLEEGSFSGTKRLLDINGNPVGIARLA